MEDYYLFGKFEDDKKEKTMSFRVSKETHDLFKEHAKYNFGDVSKGLKEIFLDYMSSHAVRRQSLTHNVKIFIPRCKEEEFEQQPYLPCNDFNIDGVRVPFDLLDLENVIVDDDMIWDYNKLDLSKWYNEDAYKDDSGWVSKKSVYNIDDGFVIRFPLNNQLDRERHGIYCINDDKDGSNNAHLGLVIVDYEDIVYYVEFLFTITPDKPFPIDVMFSQLVTNKQAFEDAWDCGNLELAKLIDGFNEGISNIEHDREMLLEKREKLLLQIEEIDDKLSKF